MNERFVPAFLDELEKLGYVEPTSAHMEYAKQMRTLPSGSAPKGGLSKTPTSTIGKAIMRRASRPPGTRQTQIFKRPTQTT